MLSTGHSYERAQIQRWLLTKDTCPKTGDRVDKNCLIPNWTLKTSIQDWQNKQAAAITPEPYQGYQASEIHLRLRP